jgi:predicted TIM-barrel fold metal-dependent hydrolase
MRWAVLLVFASCTCPGASPPHFRKVDVHTHFGPDSADHAMKLMADHGIDACVDLSGGFPGGGLEEQLKTAARFPGRMFVFANLDWEIPQQRDDFGEPMAQQLRHAKQLGAKGLKIPKALGLIWRDRTGKLIEVDDPRLDVVFETAGELGMPVAIHVGDPVAFWQPVTPENERYAELSVHPRWSYAGKAVPSWEELFAALTRRIARHPKTTFISVHFGNAPEYPDRVAALLDQYPNLYVDTAARVPELGRAAPEKLRAIFEKHGDRILFGTDLGVGRDPSQLMLGSPGKEPPTTADIERFFSATWRYFETNDRQFDHPTPIQGSWKIDGLGLSKAQLTALYSGNADRLLGLGAAK